MDNKHLYEVSVNWQSDRKGQLDSPVLDTRIEVATPPEFANGMPGIWSPEHLFVAAVNSCLMTTFLAIADNSKLPFVSFGSRATGVLEQVEGKFMMTEVHLYPTVEIENEAHRDRMLRVLQKAEQHCLISNSIKSAVHMTPVVEVVAVPV